ncbi:hypothetical protein FHP05_10140 [Cerasibacillus terrae]|uniref:Uncharacterized protein n=1 Tax=Cerasibacillus terrae TaxID=2498845 RepID=A0A5C8NQL2_9BACI|nr:hypothetical protein [Cerasibacillus terrae]TXL64039.1 hypothetical protein FHP05_10140 [Cerasibacillus terrae]
MGKIIEFAWHKIAMVAIMYYYSLCFTTLCLPLIWWHYRLQITNYYIISISTLLLGALILNTILAKTYPIKADELNKGFRKKMILNIFVGKFPLDLLFFTVILVLTDNVVLSLYFLLFLISGAYFWFCILRGYILARKNHKGSEINNSIPLKGKVLVFCIPVSLLLGYLILL